MYQLELHHLEPHHWIAAVAINSSKLLRASLPTLVFLTCVSLTACQLAAKDPPILEEAPTLLEVLPSAQPITQAGKMDIVFAQTGLNQLGFKLGQVDGFWGPRSARAMVIFEKANNLQTAQGRLSLLNLYMLNKVTNIDRSKLVMPAPASRTGLIAKLDKQTPLSTAPQLVMTDRDYTILARTNPYSDKLTNIPAGSGLYIIQLREGWFEVESRSGVRGFINTD